MFHEELNYGIVIDCNRFIIIFILKELDHSTAFYGSPPDLGR